MADNESTTKDMTFAVRCLYDDFVDEGATVDATLFADDFAWYPAESTPAHEGSPHRGLEAFLSKSYWNQPEWEQCGFRIDEVLAGEKIVMQGYYTGVYKPTGKALCAQLLHVWTLENGKITKMQELTDTQDFVEAMAN